MGAETLHGALKISDGKCLSLEKSSQIHHRARKIGGVHEMMSLILHHVARMTQESIHFKESLSVQMKKLLLIVLTHR